MRKKKEEEEEEVKRKSRAAMYILVILRFTVKFCFTVSHCSTGEKIGRDR